MINGWHVLAIFAATFLLVWISESGISELRVWKTRERGSK